jgi:hypothetical protein
MAQKVKAKFSDYVRMPEMRAFWLLSGLIIFAIILGFVYFPGIWRPIGLGAFALSWVAIFFMTSAAAKANFSSRQSSQLLRPGKTV